MRARSTCACMWSPGTGDFAPPSPCWAPRQPGACTAGAQHRCLRCGHSLPEEMRGEGAVQEHLCRLRLYPCFLAHPVSFPFRVSPQHPLVSSLVSRGNSVEISWFGPNKQNQPKAKRQKYKRARPPGEGEREDPLRPHSPGETSAGPSTPSEAVEPGEAGGDEGRQRRKRHQQRGKRP